MQRIQTNRLKFSRRNARDIFFLYKLGLCTEKTQCTQKTKIVWKLYDLGNHNI